MKRFSLNLSINEDYMSGSMRRSSESNLNAESGYSIFIL